MPAAQGSGSDLHAWPWKWHGPSTLFAGAADAARAARAMRSSFFNPGAAWHSVGMRNIGCAVNWLNRVPLGRWSERWGRTPCGSQGRGQARVVLLEHLLASLELLHQKHDHRLRPAGDMENDQGQFLVRGTGGPPAQEARLPSDSAPRPTMILLDQRSHGLGGPEAILVGHHARSFRFVRSRGA